MAEQSLSPLLRTQKCSRRHAIKIFAAAAGGLVCRRRLLGSTGQVPWDGIRTAKALTPDALPLSLGGEFPYRPQTDQRHPTLALAPGGERLWTSWTRTHRGADGIWLRSFSTQTMHWGEPLPVSEHHRSPRRIAHESEITFVGGKLLIVWSEWTENGWTVCARSFDPATMEFGDVSRLAGGGGTGEVHFRPVAASAENRALVVWQGKSAAGNTFGILSRLVDQSGCPVTDVTDVTADSARDCCHPSVAAAPDGEGFAIAFDRQEQPGTQNVHLVLVDGRSGERCEPIQVSHHVATDLRPAVEYSPDGRYLWVAWHSNRKGEDSWDIPRWYRLRVLRLSDRTWHRPAGGAPAADLDKRGMHQSFELMRLAIAPNGVVCVLGRPSHNFCLQYYSTEGRSPVYRLPKDGWGGRGRWLRGVFDDHGSLWVTRRDLQTNVLHRIDGFDASLGAPALERDESPGVGIRRTRCGTQPRYRWPEDGTSGDGTDLQLFFGDIHGHSWQSDGMGEVEESYLRARDVFRDDFHVLTDHDRFVGKRIMAGQWQEQKDIAEHFHSPGTFVTLFGQEWTTPRITRPHGWGHFNIYSADPRVPLFDHADLRFRDLPDLLEALRTYRAIAIPHHIGWTGVRWEVWDPELVPAVEICSVHGAFEHEGNTPIRHRGGVKGCFAQDGLAAGQRFGLVAGSDQHGLIWHHGVCWKRDAYRAGLTGLWAPELTRDAILDAIRARHTFATSGVKLCLRFTIDGQQMGSFIETGQPPTVYADVAIPSREGRLGRLQVVRNGSVIHTYGGEGQRSRYSFIDEECPRQTVSHYYLRVTLVDDNQAWSSPIWVTRT